MQPTKVSNYRPGEAMNTTVTAREFMARHEPAALEMLADQERDLIEITDIAHTTARRLGLEHSPAGQYAPVVWEIALP